MFLKHQGTTDENKDEKINEAEVRSIQDKQQQQLNDLQQQVNLDYLLCLDILKYMMTFAWENKQSHMFGIRLSSF